MSLLVLGAAGRLGRRVVALLQERGVDVDPLPRTVGTDRVEGQDVVCNLASSAEEVVGPWARAGARAGGYVDAAPTGSSHLLLAAEPPPGAGPVVPGVGWFTTLGDAIAVVAADRLRSPVRADVTAWVPARRSLVAGATPRERRELWESVARPVTSLVDDHEVADGIARDRRLAWFPRPVGPHHAAAVPGSHWRSLPRVVPGLATVRTALALRSSSAEVLQGLGELARRRAGPHGWPPLVPRRSADRGTSGERWAIVAEVAGAEDGLARGWAYGQDRHEVTARIVASVLARLAATDDRPRASGVVGATELVAPAELLDELAARTSLRWSVSDDDN